MNEFKTIYIKPKSWFRNLLQKLFLKLLEKIFNKNFLIYKNKIRKIMNVRVTGLFFILRVFSLRFKYPLYYNLPSRHLYCVDLMIKLLKILKKQKINPFLIAGSLLGVVRQESFAGRPQDIDLGIKENDFENLLKSFPLIIKSGASSIRKITYNNFPRIQILFPHTLVDIAVFKKQNEIWLGEPEKYYDKKNNGTTFLINDLEQLILINAYGRKFPSPRNPEIYLDKKYGNSWKKPDKKQFFWNKDKYI